jgi:hypothetical protein
MLQRFVCVLIITSVISGCAAGVTVSTVTATSPPTKSSTPRPSPTLSSSPTKTRQPTSTLIPTSTLFYADDPIFDELDELGYILDEEPQIFSHISPSEGATFFSNMGEFFGLWFGGPADAPKERLVLTSPEGRTYTYLQYLSSDGKNCHLLFFVSDQSENVLIGDVDASQINARIRDQGVTSAADALLKPPLFCLPYGWGDVNYNNLPDMAVTFLWGNNYNGGEVHIFEITQKQQVVNLTEDLPGPVNYWEFDPLSAYPDLMVMDLAWAEHDCLYPGSPKVFRIFSWSGSAYIDIMSNEYLDFSSWINQLTGLVESSYGGPFIPPIHLGPILTILLLYDNLGEREICWGTFLEMIDSDNWPGTDARSQEWLQAEVDHFRKFYNAGKPFTPGRYSGYCEP